MTLPTERPRTDAEDPGPPAEAPEEPSRPSTAEKLGIEDRSRLLFAVVVAFIVLAFTGMVVLTALAGGSGYLPWNAP